MCSSGAAATLAFKTKDVLARRRRVNAKYFDTDLGKSPAAGRNIYGPKPPAGVPPKRRAKRSAKSPRQKRVEQRLSHLRKALTEYQTSSPRPNTFGRTMAKKSTNRIKLCPRMEQTHLHSESDAMPVGEAEYTTLSDQKTPISFSRA